MVKKRLCIFCFYDKDGIVDKYIEHYLKEMLKVVKELVVVVNGYINSEGYNNIYRLTDKIYIRENKGFDAGAYKDCIFNYIGIDKIRLFDELIIANDTCFGPFISFEDIFVDMEKCQYDFWGMKKINKDFYTHIQSWFMVFRKDIINDIRFYNYWDECINTECSDIYDIYSLFEVGIYRKLTSFGYIAGVYQSKDNIDSYTSSYWGLKYGEVFLKKKVLDKNICDASNLYNSLKYINDTYNYDMSLIEDVAERKYNLSICKIKQWKYTDEKCNIYQYLSVKGDDIIEKCKNYKNIYIYGAGIIARHVMYFLLENKISINAFFVTKKDNATPAYIHNIKVLEWDKKYNEEKICVIIALNYKYSQEIYNKIQNKVDSIWLW